MTATHPRFRPALLACLIAVVAFCVVLLPMRSYAGPAPEVLQAVHTDALHTTYDGSVLRLSTRIGLGEYREADPANLIFNLEDKASARVELPDLPAFAFLGKPGDPVWIAPESQDPDLIWPGWDTETIAPGVLAGDAVDLTLLSATGPGNVEIFFNYDEFTGTAQRLFSAADEARRVLHQPVGRHVHANWAFTALGTYNLTFQATATTTAGTPLASTPTTYTFVVGQYVPPTTPTPSNTPTHPPTSPTATPTGPGHPTSTPTKPGRPTLTPTTPTRSIPTGTTPAPSGGITPTTTPPPTPPGATRNPNSPGATPNPPAPSSTPPRTSSFSGGDEEHATSDSPPNSNNTGTPPGNLPPCITTSNNPATTNPPTPGNPTAGTTNPPGSTNSPDPTAPTGTAPTKPADPDRTTLDNGHADYAVRLENGTLKSRVKDGTKPGAPIWRDPSAVTIRLTAAAKTSAPGGAFAFLGPTGSPLWQIPQTQKDGVIWLGWNTEELTKSQLATPVDWRLTRVTGPGTLAVFEFDSFGRPKIIFNSRDGLPDTYKIPLGTHAHGNWSFTKPGTYQATFTHTATLTPGKPSTTTSTLTFVVPATSANGAHPATFHNASAGAPDRHHTPSNPTGWTARSAQGLGSPQTQVAVWRSTGSSGAGGASGAAGLGRAEPVQATSAVLAARSPSRTSVVIAAASPARADSVGCKLASTGAEVGPAWIGAGATLLVIGAVTVVATRRRKGDA